MSKKRDWTGFIVVIPDQHKLVITGKWEDGKDMWWWKCRDCFKSSGVMSLNQLHKLEKKGMIDKPDGDIPSQYSSHPDENDYMSYMGMM